MHGTQKLGSYWRHIPENGDRECCTNCQITELMEHILINCEATARTLIWQLAKDLWPHTHIPWPEINLGIILGSGSITLPNAPQEEHEDQTLGTQRNRARGARHLLQILVSEAAHLIWVLRCERVIKYNGRQHPDKDIKARWLHVINTRLTEDKLIASKVKRDKQTLRTVRETWEPILKRFIDLPHNWVHQHEVLVGRRSTHLAREGHMI